MPRSRFRSHGWPSVVETLVFPIQNLYTKAASSGLACFGGAIDILSEGGGAYAFASELVEVDWDAGPQVVEFPEVVCASARRGGNAFRLAATEDSIWLPSAANTPERLIREVSKLVRTWAGPAGAWQLSQTVEPGRDFNSHYEFAPNESLFFFLRANRIVRCAAQTLMPMAARR